MSDNAVQQRAGRPFVVPSTKQAGAVAGLLLAVFAALVLIGGRVKPIAAAVADLGFPALALVYLPLAVLAVRSARGRLRAAWAMVAAALSCMASGDLLWTYYKHTVGNVPFPSWADVAYLSYVPLICIGLVLFPGRRSWRDSGRLLLDGLLVACSFFLISWVSVMRAAWHEGASSQLNFAVSLAYPAGDVLTVTVGFLVLLRARSGLRVTLTLLVIALACQALGNGLWAFMADPDGYRVGGVPDIFYAANYLLVIVALVSAQHVRSGDYTAGAPLSRLSLWLPLLPVAVAAVFIALAHSDVTTEAPVVVTGSVLIGATLLRQFLESTELVRRENEIRDLADRLTGELDSASHYVASILPGPLEGPVQVSSRYLPARAVGGDSFGYGWIDDDHLIVYLIDVSGHGVEPALLSVSVHNLLRSGGLSLEVLCRPDAVLAELNDRFNMDSHDGHYFTMWYGVYQLSTGVLRYANAGHPPPLLLTVRGGALECTPLEESSLPVGMFPDAEFTTESCSVPSGSRLLLYSDGTLGDAPDTDAFIALCTQLSGQGPDWLDALTARLPVAADGDMEDDCSLVEVTFPGASADAGAVSAVSAAHPR
jgi:serine phosphatase RsbU (regulator of sigma subunit)